MIKFPRLDVLAACAKYGPLLDVDPSLSGPVVMAAIASNESSLGLNCGPRHEGSYDAGGTVYNGNEEQRVLVAKFGSEAAMSYGPWQVMFINCPGWTPTELNTDLDAGAKAFLAFFNRYVIGTRHAKTLSEIGQVYNGGHIFTGTMLAGVRAYVDKLQASYADLQSSFPPKV